MNHVPSGCKRLLPAFFLLAVLCAGFGCSQPAPIRSESLPPILAQCEVMRPYDKVADIQVQRERHGFPSDLNQSDYDWAYRALREEAAKLGADAVIYPEVTIESGVDNLIPSIEMRAKGIAVRFR